VLKKKDRGRFSDAKWNEGMESNERKSAE